MASPLSNLASNIQNLPNLKSHFSNQEEIDLLSQMGIYPYDYIVIPSEITKFKKMFPVDPLRFTLNFHKIVPRFSK